MPFVRSSAAILDPRRAQQPLPLSRESSFAANARNAYRRGLDPAGSASRDGSNVIAGSNVIDNGIVLVSRGEERVRVEEGKDGKGGRARGAVGIGMVTKKDDGSGQSVRLMKKDDEKRGGGAEGGAGGGGNLSMEGKFITQDVDGSREETNQDQLIRRELREKPSWDHGGGGGGGGEGGGGGVG